MRQECKLENSSRSTQARKNLWDFINLGATFASAFLGVYLAMSVQRQEDIRKEIGAYGKIIAIMGRDCTLTLQAAEKHSLSQFSPSPTAPAFLLETAFRNILVLSNMPETALVTLMSESASAARSQNEMERRLQHPLIANGIPPEFVPLPPGERHALTTELEGIQNGYKSSLDRYRGALTKICLTLSSERKRVDNL